MKLRNLFVIALLAGTLGVFGCSDDPATGNGGNGGEGTAGTGGEGTAGTGGEGTAGSGGEGTAGSGGSGIVCDPTVEDVCAACDVPARIPNCVSTYGTCLDTDPSLNPCEKCGVTAIAQCSE